MICKEMDAIVVRNFATDRMHHYATRHLLVLKFICPAIASPHAFGIVTCTTTSFFPSSPLPSPPSSLPLPPSPFPSSSTTSSHHHHYILAPPSPATSRSLVLLSKTIQRIAAGTFLPPFLLLKKGNPSFPLK